MALDAEILQLQTNPLFALFDAEALRLLAFSSDTRVLRTEDVLFRADDISDGGYFIVSGSILLTMGSRDEVLEPGALIGESALFAETRRPATAVAASPSVVRRIPRHLMRRVLAAYPAVATRLQGYLKERIVSAGDSLSRVDALLIGDDEEA